MIRGNSVGRAPEAFAGTAEAVIEASGSSLRRDSQTNPDSAHGFPPLGAAALPPGESGNSDTAAVTIALLQPNP
jgi:hypothetical protein